MQVFTGEMPVLLLSTHRNSATDNLPLFSSGPDAPDDSISYDSCPTIESNERETAYTSGQISERT